MIEEHIKTLLFMSLLILFIFGIYALTIYFENNVKIRNISAAQIEFSKKSTEVVVVQK